MLPRELFLQIESFTRQGPESTRATTKNNRGFCTLEKLPSATRFTLASGFKTHELVKLAVNLLFLTPSYTFVYEAYLGGKPQVEWPRNQNIKTR